MAEAAKPDQATTDVGTGTTTPPAAAAPAAGTPPAGTPPAADTGKPPETASKDGAAVVAPKAPEKYALHIPQGAEVFIDAADLEQWAKDARESDWTQDQAQAALDSRADLVAAQLTKFRVETENDPVYGKDHLEANQQLGQHVVDRFRPTGHPRAESFNRFLKKTGAANHIEMFALLADIGKAMAEDAPPRQGSSSQPDARATAAEKLYGAEKS